MAGVEILGGMAESEPARRERVFRHLMSGVEMLGGMAESEVTRHDKESKH